MRSAATPCSTSFWTMRSKNSTSCSAVMSALMARLPLARISGPIPPNEALSTPPKLGRRPRGTASARCQFGRAGSAKMKHQRREDLLRAIRKCLEWAHEAEKQGQVDRAKRYAETGQRLLMRLHKQSLTPE